MIFNSEKEAKYDTLIGQWKILERGKESKGKWEKSDSGWVCLISWMKIYPITLTLASTEVGVILGYFKLNFKNWEI